MGEAKRGPYYRELKAKLEKLTSCARNMKPAVFDIKGIYHSHGKELVYLDTNVIINIEKDGVGEDNPGNKWRLIQGSKARFDYYYSPSHVEDIQKRDNKIESKRGFLDLINKMTDTIEIHRVDDGVRLDYENVYSCDRRVNNGTSMKITSTVEDVRLTRVKDVNLSYSQCASEKHRREINDKDLFGVDKILLEEALVAVEAPFRLEDVKGIFNENIKYICLNDIVYKFSDAFDLLHFWTERMRDENKIKNSVHDIEHIIYACYSNIFVTGDNRLYHRAKGSFGWIAPHINVLKENEFYDMLTNGI